MEPKLERKIAVVTGGTSGIGLATAKRASAYLWADSPTVRPEGPQPPSSIAFTQWPHFIRPLAK